MGTDSRILTSFPPLVALSGWILPGAGYLLIGQRARALSIGITILVLFITGLLIAGIRVIEVPGYNSETGERVMIPVELPLIDARTNKPVINSSGHQAMGTTKQWVLTAAPLSEIQNKPWSVPQVLAGPIAVISGAGSVAASAKDPATMRKDSNGLGITSTGTAYGAQTHARINEIGSLYLSVAGLLNLMAMIDSTWRASQMREKEIA